MRAGVTQLLSVEVPRSHQPAWYTQRALHQWSAAVTAAFPSLSKTQAAGLATWSFGMVLARSCALSAVRFFLAKVLARKDHTVRQRLREFYPEATAKKGAHRRALDVTAGFGPLLRWVLRDWQGRH